MLGQVLIKNLDLQRPKKHVIENLLKMTLTTKTKMSMHDRAAWEY